MVEEKRREEKRRETTHTNTNKRKHLQAKYVVRFLHPAEKGIGIDVGYVAHPSWVEASELSAIQGPLSISAAGLSARLLSPTLAPAHISTRTTLFV
jgi:hypothetical protein